MADQKERRFKGSAKYQAEKAAREAAAAAEKKPKPAKDGD